MTAREHLEEREHNWPGWEFQNWNPGKTECDCCGEEVEFPVLSDQGDGTWWCADCCGKQPVACASCGWRGPLRLWGAPFLCGDCVGGPVNE